MMLLTSTESSMHSMTPGMYLEDQNGIHPILDENVNERNYCEPSTSYHKFLPNSPLNTSAISNYSYSSPSRFQGSSRDAIGLIYNRDDFEVVEHLGEGFFGNVYKVRSLINSGDLPGILVMKVAKILSGENEAARLSAKRSVTKETSVLLKLKHRNILGFCGLCIDRTDAHWSLHLLTEFCDRGSLQSLILSTDRDFPWLQRCLIAMDVANAMAFVNARGFMHRDLTSMNVLLKSLHKLPFAKAVVADFGLSAEIPRTGEHAQQVGTQNFMSPEMLLEKPYDEKSDVFSLGIIICQMVARIDADHDAGLFRTRKFGINFMKFVEKCPSDTPVSFLELAFLCCKYQSSLRPSFSTIYEKLHQLVDDDLKKWDKLVEYESFSSVEEVRFGRSHSDAAIRAESSLSNTTMKSAKVTTPVTIPEGVEIDSALAGAITSVARSFADEEPEEYSKNPFHSDARIRSSCRKIKPSESFNRRRFARTPPIKKRFVLPFLRKASKVLLRRRASLNRSLSLPSELNLHDNNLENAVSHLPMDSNSASLKKISQTFALGRKMHSVSTDDREGQSFNLKMPPRRHTVMQGFHAEQSESSDDSFDISEASTVPMRRIESYEGIHDFVDNAPADVVALHSWSFGSNLPKNADAVETVVKQASQLPNKRRICSFASYPEEVPKNKDTCAIL